MVGMHKKGRDEARAAAKKRKRQQKAPDAAEQERRDATEERPYKPAAETDVLGWGHRKESPP